MKTSRFLLAALVLGLAACNTSPTSADDGPVGSGAGGRAPSAPVNDVDDGGLGSGAGGRDCGQQGSGTGC